MSKQSESGIKSVHLTLEIIEQIATDSEVGVSELAVRLHSTKGTIYRHLQTLVERGYVTQNPGNSRYRLGVGTFLLGQAAADSIDLLTATADPMHMTVAQTGLTAVMSTVTERGVTVMRSELGKSSVEIGVRPGSLLALHASSQGKVALAFKPELATGVRSRVLKKFTSFTLTDWSALEKEVERIKARGWAFGGEELLLGINSIAAPVYDAAGECVATLAILGSMQNVHRDTDPAQVRTLLKAARLASRNLGYRG